MRKGGAEDSASAKRALRPALRALAERQRRHLGPHLAADELVAYHERRMAEAEAERVRDHLALCPQCAGLLLDVDAFAEPSPAGAPGLTTAEVEAAWRELAPRLAEERRPEPSPPGAPSPPALRPLSSALPWALAAALLLAVLGLGLRMAPMARELVGLRERVRELARPRADGQLAELVSADDARTRGGPAAVATIVAGRPALLLLEPPLARSFAGYEIEIRDAFGRSRFRGEASSSGDAFRLALPAGALVPGSYRVTLYGLEAGRRLPLEELDLQIVER